jgi:N-acyl-D-aspartate/D-glutamate deacylase
MNTSMDGERDLERHGSMTIAKTTEAAGETTSSGIRKMKREDPQNNADTLFLANSPTGKWEKYKGMKLVDIAKDMNKGMVETMLDMSLEENLTTSWKTGKHDDHASFRSAIKEIVNHPYTCAVGLSDGGAHTKFLTLGEWPTRMLSEVVRNDQMISLEDVHWKMSKYPAQASGMYDRGSIAVGMPADIVVYDIKALKLLPEEVLYDQPGGEWRRAKKADGYRYTIVNGEITFIGNKCTGATPGRLLRHGRAQDMI